VQIENSPNSPRPTPSAASGTKMPVATRRKSIQLLKFFGVVLVCVAPVIASYAAYYFYKPEKRNNYGTLLEPQRSARELKLTSLEGKAIEIESFRKKFVMVQVLPIPCDEACSKNLYFSRQVHTMTGKERERVERLWLIPISNELSASEGSNASGSEAWQPKIDSKLIAEKGDLTIATVSATSVQALLPPDAGNALMDHIFLIDYQGNLMMRFPKNPDPYKMKKDLSTLLKAASIR
jgi:hypothetical protein